VAVAYARRETPYGTWWVAWTQAGVCAAAPPETTERAFAAMLRAEHGEPPAPGDPEAVPEAVDWSVIPDGFRKLVLQACAEIPLGEVRSYGELADEVGHPRAARAVGTVMATNSLPLFVPCHRVVRGDGRLGEYGAGGPARKAAMLGVEGVALDGREATARVLRSRA
jgi:methylated-DNA-[protein]-cysteine S-methyltransferase